MFCFFFASFYLKRQMECFPNLLDLYPLFKELVENVLKGEGPFKIKLERGLDKLYITFEGN